MDRPNAAGTIWSEEDSARFLDMGHIYTPRRDEIEQALLDLIPADRDEAFLAVELGVGGGWLSAAILRQFPAARVLGLDGSAAMLRATAQALEPFPGRWTLREFGLGDRAWRDEMEGEVRCFVSSLVIHHLDGAGKAALYRDLACRLDPLGAVLIADIVAPRSERERRHMARSYDAAVARQSLAITGSSRAHDQFVADRWNWFDYPDPVDMPSALPDHLAWLSEAGLGGVNVFWEHAGHALYGGYRRP